jgi:outer membrane protein assembly factor BamB
MSTHSSQRSFLGLRRQVVLAGLLALSTVSGSGADWAGFRGPAGNGVSQEAGVPERLDAGSIVWGIDLPGRGVSSPLIIGDRVLVTASSGARGDRLHVLCFRLSDGQLRWERQVWATGRTMTHEKISPAVPTPVSDGKAVYAIFSSNDCVALDLDGNLLWYRGLGKDYPNASNSLGMSSSLVFADGVLVAQVENDSESFTAGLDAATGRNRWKLERPKRANWTSPSVMKDSNGATLVLLQSSKGLTAVEPSTGRVVWNWAEGASTVPSTAVVGNRLYVPSNGLTVLEMQPDNSSPKSAWRSPQLRPGTASPLVLEGKVLVLNDQGILTCGDTGEGRRLWQLRLKGPFSATPVSAGGKIYCVNEVGMVQVVDPSGAEGTVVSELDLGQPVIGTPSIAAGSLFVRSDRRLFRIGRQSPL